MATKIRVRKINGELNILTSHDGVYPAKCYAKMPTGCSTNDGLLDQLAIRYNYAIEFELIEI